MLSVEQQQSRCIQFIPQTKQFMKLTLSHTLSSNYLRQQMLAMNLTIHFILVLLLFTRISLAEFFKIENEVFVVNSSMVIDDAPEQGPGKNNDFMFAPGFLLPSE